jgi:hypothetical protein
LLALGASAQATVVVVVTLLSARTV